jgi:thiol-disulfide isomerase/thioredoxin
MVVQIGSKAPNLQVSKWVQGKPTNIDQEKGNVVLVEVFQVNCPGCFISGFPEAIEIYKKYRESGLTVLAIATAFEDFDKNNLPNLEKLVATGEVIGETYSALARYGQLKDGRRLPYNIPFAVGMDTLIKEAGHLTDDRLMDFIEANVPNYRSYSEKDRQLIIERARRILRTKEYSAKTFEEYALHGTPSSILVDRKGILRSTYFGSNGFLEEAAQQLLKE